MNQGITLGGLLWFAIIISCGAGALGWILFFAILILVPLVIFVKEAFIDEWWDENVRYWCKSREFKKKNPDFKRNRKRRLKRLAEREKQRAKENERKWLEEMERIRNMSPKEIDEYNKEQRKKEEIKLRMLAIRRMEAEEKIPEKRLKSWKEARRRRIDNEKKNGGGVS